MRHRKPSDYRRDRVRALWAGSALLIICASSLYLARNKVIQQNDRWRTIGGAGHTAATPKPLVSGAGEGPGANASVLFVPQQGNRCRQREIDNKTWSIRDKGFVTCDEAVSWNANTQNPSYPAVSRVDAIRSGFFRK